jgi:hypothetical protein
VLLRDACLRAGVREYWLIDARGTEIRCEILWNAGEKWASSGHPFEPQESRVLGGRWTLVRRRNRLGRFEYSLTHDV